MFCIKNIIFVFLIFFISNCSFNNLQKIDNKNKFSVKIDTPNDKYNIYFKESLKRLFYFKNDLKKKYELKTKITFQSTKTLSVSGTNVLKSTKANITYDLRNKETNTIIKSGSINTFPALSSSSNSHYSQEKSIEHIKERLIKSSAMSLYMRINSIIRRLS